MLQVAAITESQIKKAHPKRLLNGRPTSASRVKSRETLSLTSMPLLTHDIKRRQSNSNGHERSCSLLPDPVTSRVCKV
jgi:hypothetical protein